MQSMGITLDQTMNIAVVFIGRHLQGSTTYPWCVQYDSILAFLLNNMHNV